MARLSRLLIRRNPQYPGIPPSRYPPSGEEAVADSTALNGLLPNISLVRRLVETIPPASRAWLDLVCEIWTTQNPLVVVGCCQLSEESGLWWAAPAIPVRELACQTIQP